MFACVCARVCVHMCVLYVCTCVCVCVCVCVLSECVHRFTCSSVLSQTLYMYILHMNYLQQRISITVGQRYTRKHHEFVAVVLIQVCSTSNNTKGNKRVICFQYRM